MASGKPPTMGDRLVGVTRADVTFVQQLNKSEFAVIYKVKLHGVMCVMKVYKGIERCYADPPDREVDIFISESTAYRRLKSKGLCEQQLIPDFYGTIPQMDPTHWQPYLDTFCKDKLRPSAVLMEYIPDLHMLDLSTFSELRLLKFRAILAKIHEARVLHGDAYPRNMVIQKSSDRVLWIDFDRAETYPEDRPLTQRETGLIHEEKEIIDYFSKALGEDFKDGELTRTRIYYYE